MRKLRLGLAGLGHGATVLEANDSDIPIEVVALCDTDEACLQTVSGDRRISQATTDFDELVSIPDIDVVGIYTPGPLHADQIEAALDAGKHVMVTKSMVYSIAEAERVIKAVDRTGRTLLVTQTMRGRHDFMDAKRTCDAGTIGELFMAEAHYVHDLRPVYARTPWRVEMPQDLILGGACHPIDLLRWFMGDIIEIHCYGLKSGIAPDYPREDTFVMNVRFASGKIGRVANFLGVVHPPGVPMNSLTVYGTRGTIRDNQIRLDADEWLPERTYSASYPSQRGHSGEMMVMLQHMADCVLNGATPWVGAREGARGGLNLPRRLGLTQVRLPGRGAKRVLGNL